MSKTRYHEGLPDAVKLGWKLADRVKQISKCQYIDSRVSLQRFVSESILWALIKTAPHLDPVVKGGLLHDQRTRATGDADVMLTKPRSAVDLFGDVSAAAALLREHGIMWSPGDVKPMSMGGRGSGFRIDVDATLGITRVRTHLDVSFGALPEGSVRKEFRSMFKAPSFTAWAQPLEAQVADKLAAIVTIGMENTRLKDYRDLIFLKRAGLSDTAIARHLYATMRERKADMATLLQPVPEGLSFDFVDSRTWDWRGYAAPQAGLSLNFLEVVCDLRHWYADIMDRFHRLAAADRLEPRCHMRAPGIETPDDVNVYDLAAYRLGR